MWISLITILAGLTVAKGEEKKACFIPTHCSENFQKKWLEFDPTGQCAATGLSEANDSAPTHLNKTRAKELVKENIQLFRSHFENITEVLFSGITGKMKEFQFKLEGLNKTFQSRLDTLNEDFVLLSSRFKNFSQSLEDTKQRPMYKYDTESLPVTCEHLKGIMYLDKCFWMMVRGPSSVDFADAEELCAARDGEPGDVLEEAHYYAIKEHLLSRANTSIQYIWTGMKYDPKTNVTTTSEGMKAPFVQWLTGQPRKRSQRTHMAIKVYANTTFVGRMRNRKPEVDLDGVFCQSKNSFT